jgi:hypothetical protein
MAEFRKRQEQLRKQQNSNAKNANANSPTGPVVNSNDAGAPPL